MAIYVYWGKGPKVGTVNGSCDQQTHEKSTICYAYTQPSDVPTHSETGVATGRAVQGPVKLIVELDAATPLLNKAVRTGDTLDQVVIKFFKIKKGVEDNYYTVTLKEARVTKAEEDIKHTLQKEYSNLPHTVNVELRGSSIGWCHTDGGIEDVANWKELGT